PLGAPLAFARPSQIATCADRILHAAIVRCPGPCRPKSPASRRGCGRAGRAACGTPDPAARRTHSARRTCSIGRCARPGPDRRAAGPVLSGWKVDGPPGAGSSGEVDMTSTFLARGTALTIAIALAAALSGQASAQCLITGPSSMCSGAVQLCGDSGPYNWEWTGPNGFTATTQCIFAVEPGTYSLRVYDVNNDLWFGPCTQTITQDTGPSATISGPTSGCAGATVDLCGPAGGYMYTWSGPNGFSACTPRVGVGQAGPHQPVRR